jgi:hypothetical protein
LAERGSYEEIQEKREIEKSLTVMCFLFSAFAGYLLLHLLRF